MVTLSKWIKEKSKTRKMVIWGTGNNSVLGEALLKDCGILKWYYCSSKGGGVYKECQVYNPKELKDSFYIISSIYFDEIKNELDTMGLEEFNDWIWVFDKDYYVNYFKYMKAPRVPDLTFEDIDSIEEKLKQICQIVFLNAPDEKKVTEFEMQANYLDIYNKNTNIRYRRKLLEYYYAFQLLNLKKDDIYVDVGACNSGFAKWLRENHNVEAYAIDINEGKYKSLPYYLKSDATKTAFKDQSIDYISMQSSFECFSENNDIKLIKEYARILKHGGKAVILPLYMHNTFISTVSPSYYLKGNADLGALECVRTDCRDGIYMARLYDVEHLKSRIIEYAEELGFKVKIYSICNSGVEKDQFIYLKFILVLEKL